MEPPDKHREEPLSTSEDDGNRRFAVVSNQPVEVINPRRQFLRLNLVWAAALLIVAFAAAFGATEVSNHRSEQKIATLLVELNKRTAERRANEARMNRTGQATARVLEQNRRTHCSEMRAVSEAAGGLTGELKELYVVYHCGTAKDPVVPPGWTPPPGWPPLPGAEEFAAPTPAPTQ